MRSSETSDLEQALRNLGNAILAVLEPVLLPVLRVMNRLATWLRL